MSAVTMSSAHLPQNPSMRSKIYSLKKILAYVDIRAGQLLTCASGIQYGEIRSGLDQAARTIWTIAGSLRNGLDSADSLRKELDSVAAAEGIADTSAAFALALEDVRHGVRQIDQQVDAAREIARSADDDGLVGNLLDEIQYANEEFRRLLARLLHEWAIESQIDISFED